MLFLCVLPAFAGCGEVDWFVSFNAGQIDAARRDGLILVVGRAHARPLQDVRLVEGELPAGMALQEDGTVRGIPEESGTFDFTIELTEIGGKVLRKSYSVEVQAPSGAAGGG